MVLVRKLFLWCIFLSAECIFANSTVVDPNLIVDKEKVLEFLKKPELKDYFFPTQSRPGKCPFKSFNHIELIMQLKELARALRNSRCDTRGQELVSNLNRMASSLRNTMILNHGIQNGGLIYAVPDVSGPATPCPVPNKGPDPVAKNFGDFEDPLDFDNTPARTKDLLRQLSAATEDPKCAEDLHKAGLVSVIADMTVSLGQSALFVPGTNGLAVGVGVLAVAATLKVVSSLLKSPYNWSLEKDRMHFLDLNCNFFDMRKELEEADFFDTRGEDKAAKAKKGKEHIELFDTKIAEIQAAKSAFEKNILESQTEFFGPKIGEKKLELYRLLLQAESTLAAKLDSEPEVRYKLTKDLTRLAPNLLPLIRLEVHDTSVSYLSDLLSPFVNATLGNITELETAKLNSNYILPLKVFLKSVQDEIDKDLQPLSHSYQKQRVSETENNWEVIERGTKIYTAILKELNDRKAQLLRRISLYEISDRKTLFGSYENGAHMDFDVLREYRDSQELILGKRGWSFLKFLIKNADRDIEKFLFNYESWKLKYQSGKKLGSDSTVWACRDAHQLRVKWNSAYSAVGMTYDFYETNKGILSSEFKTMKFGLHFFPMSRSNRLKIFRNIRSLEMAKSILEGEDEYTREDVKEAFRGHHINLGDLTIKVQESELHRNKLDDFFKEHDCLLHL